MRECNYGRQLIISMKSYAEDRDGNYPASLADIFTASQGYIYPVGYAELALWHPCDGTTSEPWLYLGAGLSDNTPSDIIILASPRSDRGKRIVGRNDGSVDPIAEADFAALLDKLHRYQREHLLPSPTKALELGDK